MLYLVGLGLGDEKDITVRGLEAVRSSDYIFLEAYTSLLGFLSYPKQQQGFLLDEEEEQTAHNSDCDGDNDEEQVNTAAVPAYTLDQDALLNETLNRMTAFYGEGKRIHLLDRMAVEGAAVSERDAVTAVADADFATRLAAQGNFLTLARDFNVSLLVVGDPLSATTHTDLLLRCAEAGVAARVIHGTSILTAIGSAGLHLYHYGPSISVPFFTPRWQPMSFYDKLARNWLAGQHTLLLLDIKVREPTAEALGRGLDRLPATDPAGRWWHPPKFMSVRTAVRQLLAAEAEAGRGLFTQDTLAVGVARLGRSDAVIITGSLASLQEEDFGPPLHSLIIPAPVASLHPMEKDMLRLYMTPRSPPHLLD